MPEPIPVIPTLHNISTPVLTQLGDQLAYVIRFYFANPGGISSNNEDELISFRKLNSLYGKRPQEMCNKVAQQLEQICHRYTDHVRVECTYQNEIHRSDEIDPLTGKGYLQGTYKMEIAVTDDDGVPLIPHRLIKILQNGDAIDVTFDHQKETGNG